MSFKTFLKSYKKKEEQNMRREKRETVVKKKIIVFFGYKRFARNWVFESVGFLLYRECLYSGLES